MSIVGNLILDYTSILVSAVACTVSFVLFFLCREKWRLYLSLFMGTCALCVGYDAIGLLLSTGMQSTLTALLVAFCLSAFVASSLLFRLYRYGLRFVLRRWEKRYLFLFLLPVAILSVGTFFYFSFDAFSILFIVLLYCSASGIVMYILSLGTMRK